MNKVELFENIRRDYHLSNLSIRTLSKKYRVHRRLIRQALQSAIPPSRKKTTRQGKVMTESILHWVKTVLISDQTSPKKQRHTACRMPG